MAKKAIVNNHIENVNMEIDYNKLAKAIVKAQEAAKNVDDSPQREKVGFWKALKMAVTESRESKGQMTALALAYSTQVILTIFFCLFLIAALFCLVIGGLALYYIYTILSAGNSANMTEVAAAGLIAAFSFSLMVLCIIFGLTLFGAANEIIYEKDRNYVVAILSAMASFSAMVISLVALFCSNR